MKLPRTKKGQKVIWSQRSPTRSRLVREVPPCRQNLQLPSERRMR